MLSTKRGNYWYHFNVFGMKRFLTGDSTRDIPRSKPSLYHKAIFGKLLAKNSLVLVRIVKVEVGFNDGRLIIETLISKTHVHVR